MFLSTCPDASPINQSCFQCNFRDASSSWGTDVKMAVVFSRAGAGACYVFQPTVPFEELMVYKLIIMWILIAASPPLCKVLCTSPKSFFFYMSFFFYFIYLFIFIYGCVGSSFLCEGFSLVAAIGGHSSSRCVGLSLSWLVLLRSTGSRCAGSVIVAHRASCSAACGIFPDQGSNPCPLHWEADSQPLRHQGSPPQIFHMILFKGT